MKQYDDSKNFQTLLKDLSKEELVLMLENIQFESINLYELLEM